MENWISVNDALPARDMKVKWLCEDGKEDFGFFYTRDNEFRTWDLLTESPITHWKSFE